MIKIAAITAYIPLVDNHNAPNAMVYSFLLNRPKNADLYLYYYPQPKVDEQIIKNDFALLNPTQSKEIKITPLPTGIKAKLKNIRQRFFKTNADKFPLHSNQYLPDASVLEELKQLKPDVIFMFPHWLIHWSEPLREFKVVVSASDSAALHFLRALESANWKTDAAFLSLLHNFKSSVFLEQCWAKSTALLHMVGKEDLKYYLALNNQKAKVFYAPHPYYAFVPVKETIDNTKEKIKLLVTGHADSIYFGNDFISFVNQLVKNNDLSKHYQLVFIGKSYEQEAKRLAESGYEITHHKWVDDFSNSIAQCHVQLFPLVVGTGTKGKVLHALATGLLGIGTRYAFENIEVTDNKDCLFYQDISELIPMLKAIHNDKNKFAAMANSGAAVVREKHNPATVGKYFWEKVLNANSYH